MNELQKRKGWQFSILKGSDKWGELNRGDGIDWWSEGFDSAIALGLPVKFADWNDNIPANDMEDMLLYFGYFPGNEDKYKYWVENIYKSKL